MRWSKPLFSTAGTLIDRILCVVGAVIFSQAPEFMQQYLQRLGGHLAEARRQLLQFEDVARGAGLSVQELAVRSLASGDQAISGLGRVVAGTEERVQLLSSAEAAIREASPFTRPFVFLQHVDMEIARATGQIFKPAVPTTLEGLLYAGVGIVVALALYHGIVQLIRALSSRAPSAEPSR